jgi:ATP-dependent RNA helicase SUPV3L1/SUV3
MQNAQPTQFKLNDQGQILFQPIPGNPLPGAPVAVLKKGPVMLAPVVEVLPGQGDQETISTWFKTHIATVLEPLVGLADEALQGPTSEIAAQVFAAMGILPREQIEGLIEKLDPDARRVLRNKKIRLGPILVFQPELNKPAAVRLRAILWSLYNDKPLPAPTPPDGAVSFRVDAAAADHNFYRAVGYPVYGPRAIRIDMLDRVIGLIYETAKGGKFKAQHQMAEWLGCNIEDLYAILTAMGHVKTEEPGEQPKTEIPTEEAKAEEQKAEPAAVDEAKPQQAPKPELATFRLKKGKAFEKGGERKPFEHKPRDKKPQPDKKPEKKSGKRNKSTNRPEKIMSAGPKPKPEDSPFAILGQLKVKKDGA